MLVPRRNSDVERHLSTTATVYTVNVTASAGTVTATGADGHGTGAAEMISFTPAPKSDSGKSRTEGTSTLSVTANYVGGKINFSFAAGNGSL